MPLLEKKTINNKKSAIEEIIKINKNVKLKVKTLW